MIKVKKIIKTEEPNVYEVELFADTKSEVVPGATIIGLPEGAVLDIGSSVMATNGDIAFMQSNGDWKWV